MYELLKMHRIVKEKKEKGDFIPHHKHSYFHCIYVLSGSGIIEVENNKIITEQNMFIKINPETEHAIFGVDNFQSFDMKFYCTGNLFEELKQSNLVVNLNGYEASIIKEIFNEAISDDVFAQEIINIKATELILRIIRKNNTKNTVNYQAIPYIMNNNNKTNNLNLAINYIENNLHKSITVSELSKISGYNSAYFSTAFKNSFGYSPNKYINLRKIEKAKELMLTTDFNITQIAEIIGVELHTFSKIFKKFVGISPNNFYKRANSDIGINISKDSPFIVDADFEIPKIKI